MFSPMLSMKSVFLLLVVVAVTVNVMGEREAGDCQDTKNNCFDYSDEDCKDFPSWAERNCAKTCGVCNPEKTGSGCPDGWTYYKGDQTCMKAFGIPSGARQPWFAAKQRCVALEGNLIAIKDKAKHDFVIAQYGQTWFETWIGTINVSTNKGRFEFQYVDGSKLGSFHPWIAGSPDNKDDIEKCVLFLKSGYNQSGKWEDYNCGVYKSFICSKPARKK